MDTLNQLRELYDRWRILTERERDAIGTVDWITVAECHREKLRLREEIQTLSDASALSGDRHRFEENHPLLGQRLIEMEQQNAEALANVRHRAEQELRDLQVASRHLRQIHQTYAQGRPSVWNSYS